jgi:hypothetical protein
VNLFVCGDLTIQLAYEDGSYKLKWIDGTNDFSVTLTQDFLSWTMLTVVRSGANAIIYANGALVTTVALTNYLLNYGTSVSLKSSGYASIFDIRRVARAVSAAGIDYLYDDVIDHSGDSTLPPY